MHKLRDDEVFVIRSIVNSIGGEWSEGEDPPDCYLDIENRTVAIEISTLTQHVLVGQNVLIPRLSQDMKALRLCSELDKEIGNKVPDGSKVLITLFNPIEKARKFKKALKERLLIELDKRTDEEVELEETILSIDVNIHILSQCDISCKKISGIVANSNSTTDIFGNAIRILDKVIKIKNEKCGSFFDSHEVWLALFNDYWLADVETYREAISESSVTHEFTKILLVSGNGSAEDLYSKHSSN